jgi:hypothetical protein
MAAQNANQGAASKRCEGALIGADDTGAGRCRLPNCDSPGDFTGRRFKYLRFPPRFAIPCASAVRNPEHRVNVGIDRAKLSSPSFLNIKND